MVTSVLLYPAGTGRAGARAICCTKSILVPSGIKLHAPTIGITGLAALSNCLYLYAISNTTGTVT